MSEVKLAIVAEYKGVAIMERAGSKRAAWRGRDYFTDGLSYLMSQQPKGEEAVTLVGSQKVRKGIICPSINST